MRNHCINYTRKRKSMNTKRPNTERLNEQPDLATPAAAPAISDAEAVVMEALWLRHPQSAEELTALVAPERGWAEATVKTLLNRLLKKEAVSVEIDGRKYLYSPRIAKTQWVSAQSTGLISRLFGGRVAPLVAHFSEQGNLTAQDIAEIKAIIKKMETKR
jgi:BlaI family transcriptional regulator, penicillinase repressor